MSPESVRPEFELFEVHEPVLLRIASRPRTRAGAAIDPDDPLPGIRQLADDRLLQQAVQVASGSLALSLRRLVGDEAEAAALGRKRTLSAARTLTRYARRSGGRPTPFGLFAGVDRARFGTAAKAGPMGPGAVSVRLDGGWLHRRVLAWLADPRVRRQVSVVLNDLCTLRDGRLTLHTGAREMSVRDNALVAAVRELAAVPVPYTALFDGLAHRLPALAPERLDAQLGGLVQHGFLLTSLTPHRIDEALLDRIETAVKGALPDEAAGLRAIRSAAATYEQDPPGEGLVPWQALLESVHRLDPPGGSAEDGRPPVHVDLRMPTDLVLPHTVGEEIRRYAAAIWAMTPEWTTLAYMRDYRDRFIERYGTASAVPLADLVDPHRGLGLPPEYTNPPAHERLGPGDDADRPRRGVIAELVQQAVLAGGDIDLTEEDVTRLAAAAGHDPDSGPPRAIELCFQLLADSLDAVDRGDFLLLGSPHIGSWTPGATAGRFAAGTGLTEDLARLVAQCADDDVLAAQVEVAPHDPRSLNIVQTPRLLPYRIPIGVADDRDDPRCLDWRTLLVAAGADGLRLLHEPTGRQVKPVFPHMLALDSQAPPVARFLSDLAVARPRVWSGWDWGGLDVLPYLPRVRHGRVLAAPRRWLPSRQLRDAARVQGTAAWREGLAEWRRRLAVPDRLQIARNDQMYPIDLRDPWDQDLLRSELTAAQPRFVLYEDLTADGANLGWNAGHSAEIVVPLVRTSAPQAADQPVAPLRRTPSGFHLPGEDWLFAKLYAEPAAHNALLTGHLPQLLAEIEQDVDRWFFLRYRDPEPHLRLRLHGDPDVLNGRVLPVLTRHARALIDSGALRTMALDTYRPETDRYGGNENLEAAERFFRTDSLSALLYLRSPASMPDEVLAALGHAVLLDSLGDWDWCAWVSRMFTKGPEHGAYQRHRATADRLIRPGGTARLAAEALSAPAVERLWTQTPEPRAYGGLVLAAPAADRDEAVLSLLHMRHNRQFGVDRTAEARGYAVLRGAARAHLGRSKHTPGSTG